MQGQGSRRATAALVVAAGITPVVLAVLLASSRFRAAWGDPWARPILATFGVALALAAGGAFVLVRRRPANRCGLLAIGVALLFGAFYLTFFTLPNHGWWLASGLIVTWSLRPVLFWLVLAYPIGRLDRSGRRFLAVYVTLAAITLTIALLTSADNYPVHVFRDSSWTRIVQSTFWDVGTLVFSAALLVVMQRRRWRLRGESAARIVGAASIAALIAVAADLVLITQGPIRNLGTHRGLLTPFATTVQVIDLIRFGLVVAVLAWAAQRAWPRATAVDASIDLDISLAAMPADVVLRDSTGNWVDGAGAPSLVPTLDGATMITADGAVIAALVHDPTIDAHPRLVDATVTATALQLEAGRQMELAQNREIELRRLAREVLDAGDDARRRLERDLHDGAQQALVGVTLQAALAARRGSETDAEELAAAIDDARVEITRIASGRPPALLAQRGLEGALGALVVTAGLPVRVDTDRCTDIGENVQRAIWFTAAEAVTNALKHAHASSLDLSLRRVDGTVTLTVRDDGRGGVSDAPATLQERVAEANGVLEIESNGRGTIVRAQFAAAPE